MSEKDLNDIIQDHFDNIKVAIDPAWRNDMSEQLDAFNKKKKRRFIFFWYTFGLLLISGITLGVYYYGNSANDLNDDRLITQTSTENNSVTGPYEPDSNHIHSQNEHTKLIEAASPKQEDQAKQVVDLSNSPTPSTGNERSEPNNNTSSFLTAGPKALPVNDKASTKSDKMGDSNNSLLSEVHPSNSSDSLSSVDSNSPHKNRTAVSGNMTNKGVQKTDSTLSTTNTDDDVNFNMETTESREWEADSLEMANTDPNDLQDPPPIDSIISETEQQPSQDADQTKRTPLWEFGVLGGASYDHRTLTALNSTPYYEERFNGENTNIGWNISLEIARKLGKYQIVSGLSYNEIRETVSYEPVSYETSQVIETYIDNSYWDYDSVMQQGVWYYFDSVYIQSTDTLYQTITNMVNDNSGQAANGIVSFRFMRIPLRFGFPIHHSSKLTVDGFIGGSVGILTTNRGNYLSNNGGTIPAQAGKVSLNSMFALRVKYPVGRRFSLGTEAYVRINHGNHSPITDVKRKYTSFGLNAGFFYTF